MSATREMPTKVTIILSNERILRVDITPGMSIRALKEIIRKQENIPQDEAIELEGMKDEHTIGHYWDPKSNSWTFWLTQPSSDDRPPQSILHFIRTSGLAVNGHLLMLFFDRPPTAAEIKLRIEEEMHIPSCIQSLAFHEGGKDLEANDKVEGNLIHFDYKVGLYHRLHHIQACLKNPKLAKANRFVKEVILPEVSYIRDMLDTALPVFSNVLKGEVVKEIVADYYSDRFYLDRACAIMPKESSHKFDFRNQCVQFLESQLYKKDNPCRLPIDNLFKLAAFFAILDAIAEDVWPIIATPNGIPAYSIEAIKLLIERNFENFCYGLNLVGFITNILEGLSKIIRPYQNKPALSDFCNKMNALIVKYQKEVVIIMERERVMSVASKPAAAAAPAAPAKTAPPRSALATYSATTAATIPAAPLSVNSAPARRHPERPDPSGQKLSSRAPQTSRGKNCHPERSEGSPDTTVYYSEASGDPSLRSG